MYNQKTSRSKVVTSFFLACCLVFSGFSFAFTVKAEDLNDTTVTIYHTNDMHGNVGGGVKGSVGLEYVSALKNKTPNSLLIDAGDPTQGFSLATFSNGQAPLTLMKLAGYDGMTLGNHEFDLGLEILDKNSTYANSDEGAFPIVSANVLNESDNKPYLAGKGENNNGQYFIKEKTVAGKTVKIGFFGLTTSSTKKNQKASNTKGLIFKDEFETAKSVIEKLKTEEKVDLVVGITHMGAFNEGEYISSHTLVQKLQKAGNTENKSADYYTPDIIIDGHSHTKESKVISNGGDPVDANTADFSNNTTVIQQNSNNLTSIGEIAINFANNKITANFGSLNANDVETKAGEPNEAVKDKYDEIWREQAQFRDTVVGKTNGAIYAQALNNADQDGHGGRIVRYTETAMGNLVTDAFRNEAKKLVSSTEYSKLPCIAVQNGAAIRTRVEPGNITYSQVTAINNFAGSLSVQKLTAKDIYAALEESLKGAPQLDIKGYEKYGINTDDAKFLSVSGLKFTYDLSKPSGERVQEVYLLNDDGNYSKDILQKDNSEILLATNDFLVNSIEDYKMFSINKQITESSKSLNDILSEYLTELTNKGGGSFTMPSKEGRIKLLNESKYFDNFDSKITVMYAKNLLKNTEIDVYLNDSYSGKYTTDNDGILTLNDLSPTSYNVTIFYNDVRSDGYIDGRTGITGDTSLGSVVDLGGTLKNTTISLAGKEISDGWLYQDSNWYYIKNGAKLTGWHNDIPGWNNWFYFSNDGAMLTGWHNDIPGWNNWFYFSNDGVMFTGWHNDIPGWNNWFYFSNDGVMFTGWHNDIPGWNNWFYFSKDGVMYIGTYLIDGIVYFFNNYGVLVE